MDPLSVTASIAGIAGVCVQAGHFLDTLRTKFQNSHVTITALSSQCRAIKAGLSQLQTLVLQNHTIRDRPDVIETLDTTLIGCLVVLTCFEDSLDKLCDEAALMESRRSLARKWWSRTHIVWNEDEMKNYLSLLQGQQSAVAFLVQILHMNSIDEILEGIGNGKGLLDKQATKAESLRYANPQLQIAESVLGSKNTADSIFRGGDTVAEGTEFQFDNAVVDSKAYRRVMAMAKEVVTKKSAQRPGSIMNLENMSFDSKTQSPRPISPLPSPNLKSEDLQQRKPSSDTSAATPNREDPDLLHATHGVPTSLDVLKSQHGQTRVYDVDYFDMRCQQLFKGVNQWVLRFSKFSDMRASRLSSEIKDERILDRLDNSVLDGSDVDTYLNDRVKRRDIFASMVMTMIWEYIFTRYLFGMDREQRLRLKTLEKQLSDIGPPATIHAWRATTLGLLSKRPPFQTQRDQDALAVAESILDTLSQILPPPSNLLDQVRGAASQKSSMMQ
ncbi:hypothetical protein CHGG_09849 [Chaetomium globosum CBS 148.51]|uniref:Azaphilone pigments biosynthesis cluster protein L N-terminal domain-containing protein n=1 Tax=Chaetomium globosum (strain ATCC 6205 / CBS 148.51 / DSM 1962 / NBRC 6347 / NRRL 1970) TaxID=306901 RepID=Q2GQA5_CHAGB|nr:uncharacterized protein CHGG_09849 [Chaetomium globosum CBS 148.51]EAQ83445.1 hypothetical protein CHGG_09849 [Chaetomium globosum CBS 148.51]